MVWLRQIAIFLFACLVAGCIKPSAPVKVAKIVEPGTESACTAVDGRWRQDPFGHYFCQTPTTDGGRACTGSEQCQAACLAPADLKPGAKKIVGACSYDTAQFGNVIYVEGGKLKYINVE